MAQWNSANNHLHMHNKTLFEVQMNNNQGSLAADFNYQVARGKVDGITLVNLYGYNSSVDGTFIPIWEANTAYTYPSNGGEQMLVYSSSASDTNVTVVINGLDANMELQTETLILTNGTTGVNTVNSYRRINQILIGGSVNPVGNIYLAKTDKSVNYAIINIGVGRSQMSMYNVPSGYTFFLNRVVVAADGTSSGKTLDYRVYTVSGNGIIGNVLTSPFATNYETARVVPTPYAEKTSVQWQCRSTQQNCAIGIRIEGLLIRNDAQ